MCELLDHRPLKQRREDVLCEVTMNRLSKELRANPERRSAQISTLMWELERHVDQLLKRSRLLERQPVRGIEGARACGT